MGKSLDELIAMRDSLADRKKNLKSYIKATFKQVERMESSGWQSLSSEEIKKTNEKRQSCWDSMAIIRDIDKKILDLDSAIESAQQAQKWDFVVSDSRLRGHIQMVVNDISRLGDCLECVVNDEGLKDSLVRLRKIVIDIQKR